MNPCLVVLSLTLGLVGVSVGHLCLLSPPQRGSMVGINKPGAPDCILLKAPCGGRDHPQEPQVVLTHGETFVVVMQKNLDHYNKTAPGFFAVDLIGEYEDSQPVEILKVPDTSAPALTLYTANVTLSEHVRPGRMIFQARYVTNNPQAPAAFYQCADIHVVPRLHKKRTSHTHY